MWQNEPEHMKKLYMEKSAEEKEAHMRKYPDYKYQPVRKNKKKEIQKMEKIEKQAEKKEREKREKKRESPQMAIQREMPVSVNTLSNGMQEHVDMMQNMGVEVGMMQNVAMVGQEYVAVPIMHHDVDNMIPAEHVVNHDAAQSGQVYYQVEDPIHGVLKLSDIIDEECYFEEAV